MGKKGKDYSAGGGKKWLIAIAIIVFVAIAVVVILLCIPPNTYNAVETLNRYSTTTFLDSKEEKQNLLNVSEKIYSTQNTRPYYDEMLDIEKLSYSIDNVIDFYNNYINFASSNKNLKKNYKPIKNNLNKAKDSQKRLANKLNEMNEFSLSSSKVNTLLANGMIDFRREYIKWLNYNKLAIDALSQGFLGSMGNIIENNPAAKITLTAVNDYIQVIYDEYKEISNNDKKGDGLKNYNYTLKDKISAFSNFIDVNILSNDSDMKVYYFDSAVQAKVEKLDNFKSVYGEKNFQDVLSSLTKSGTVYSFTKEYSKDIADKDTTGIYQSVKDFLGGK